MIDLKLPSMGSDMEEGKLLEWKVKPGDAVKKGDVVAVVDTTKAAVEVESWDTGTIHELRAAVGDTVPVGAVIATLLAEGESAPAPGAQSPRPTAPAPQPTPQAAPQAAPQPALQPAPQPEPQPARRPVSPAARVLAQKLGIDTLAVTGTGPQGAIGVEDVERAAAAAKPKDRAGGMRRSIAAAMSRSKREIPHYYLSETIPMARAAEWLAAENAKRPVSERLLMGVLQLKAVALALAKAPELNGFWKDGAFAASQAIHLGVAISIREGGLIAPAIHDVDRKTLTELMRDLSDLVARARAGSLKSSEMSDPTLTVTNLGEAGVESVQGVIYPPQVAIVGFGRMAARPWVEDGAVRALPLVTASLAADHRVSDGIRGARFLAALRERLQQPEAL